MKKRDRIAKKRAKIAERRLLLRIRRGQVEWLRSKTLRPETLLALHKAIRLERAPRDGKWHAKAVVVATFTGIELMRERVEGVLLMSRLEYARRSLERISRKGIESVCNILASA